jgi:nucleotide-binding universal stress UspA family protein
MAARRKRCAQIRSARPAGTFAARYREGAVRPCRRTLGAPTLEATEEVDAMATAPIVVGIDGSPAGLRAVDLAVREAGLRNLPVRLVYASTWTSHPAWVDVMPSEQFAADLMEDEPRRAMREALDRVGQSVPVSSEIVPGYPGSVLVEESRQAALLVVGHRGHDSVAGRTLGSVARSVAGHAHCPVLVARGSLDATGYVIVGVAGSTQGDPTLGFAFEAAALRDARLLALHTWTGPHSTGPGDMLPLVYEPDAAAAEEARVLAEALAGWQTKYPDVVVHQRVLRSRPGPALVEATGNAQLAVVGAHGRHGVPGWLVGSVPHLLLHQARCPVAVVHG